MFILFCECRERVWVSFKPDAPTNVLVLLLICIYWFKSVSDDSTTPQCKEHPMLGQPFFVLHPCKTEEFMRPVVQAAEAEHRYCVYMWAKGLFMCVSMCASPHIDTHVACILTWYCRCRKVNYVVTWLSVVGPLVGLDLPLSYSTLLHAVNEQSSC